MRDDVADAVDFTDESVSLAGTTLFAVVAVPIMASVDPVITVVLALPMIAVGVLSRRCGGWWSGCTGGPGGSARP
ncbi:hypothetical protein GCM10020220_084110 [Nonomuraea rubra]|uniref:hypothetical protein n=1 Tax=Nonomuraea rubra TaxID=46180 RepID=UPI0031EB8FD9